jgi:hypothetical protein
MDLSALSQLTYDAAVFLIHQDHFALAAGSSIALARSVVLRVVCLDVTFALLMRRCLRTLEEGCALRQDGLEGVNVLLCN